MIERGVVTKTQGNLATVSFKRRGECDKCQRCKVSNDCTRVEIQVENDNNYLSKIEAEGGTIVKLTQAEKDVFQQDLYSDAIKMGESKESNVINYEFFKQIDKILRTHRGQ